MVVSSLTVKMPNHCYVQVEGQPKKNHRDADYSCAVEACRRLGIPCNEQNLSTKFFSGRSQDVSPNLIDLRPDLFQKVSAVLTDIAAAGRSDPTPTPAPARLKDPEFRFLEQQEIPEHTLSQRSQALYNKWRAKQDTPSPEYRRLQDFRQRLPSWKMRQVPRLRVSGCLGLVAVGAVLWGLSEAVLLERTAFFFSPL